VPSLARISLVPREISFIDYNYRVELIIIFILGFNNYLGVDLAEIKMEIGRWSLVYVSFTLHLFPISVSTGADYTPTFKK
jgi:hypothetical protein